MFEELDDVNGPSDDSKRLARAMARGKQIRTRRYASMGAAIFVALALPVSVLAIGSRNSSSTSPAHHGTASTTPKTTTTTELETTTTIATTTSEATTTSSKPTTTSSSTMPPTTTTTADPMPDYDYIATATGGSVRMKNLGGNNWKGVADVIVPQRNTQYDVYMYYTSPTLGALTPSICQPYSDKTGHLFCVSNFTTMDDPTVATMKLWVSDMSGGGPNNVNDLYGTFAKAGN